MSHQPDNQPLQDTMQRPLRDLRISVTDRCNFRCTYCMPAEVFHEKFKFLKREKLLTYEEITRLAKLFVAEGAVKLRLTGGEPLLREEIEVLVNMLAQIDGVEDLAMTTNAYLLPKKAQQLKDAGLKRLTVSLDSIDDAEFRALNGDRASVDDVLKGIAAAEKVGFAPIKINAVVKRGANDGSVVDLARFCRDRGYILRFIEYMDVGTMNGWRMDHVVPAREIVERIDAVMPLERVRRSYASETALRYKYRDGGGEIGVIASVTMPFCGACSRVRLSPEGQIYTCLFATEGTDIKTPLRSGASDAELSAILRNMWTARTDRYSEIRSSDTSGDERIEMYYIGG